MEIPLLSYFGKCKRQGQRSVLKIIDRDHIL